MMTVALGPLLAAGLAVASPGDDDGSIRTAIDHARDRAEAIVTPADDAFIKARCGDDAGARTSTRFAGGALVCGDGRRFDDPETRAVSQRISARAKAHVDRVMSDPEVRAAMDGSIQRRVAASLRRAAERLEGAGRRRR